MMNYEMFKEVVKEQILNYMPDGYEDCTAEIIPILKVNQKLDALELFIPMKESRKLMDVKPRIYLNYMYKDYMRNGDLKETLEMAAQALDDGYRDMIENRKSDLLENVKDKLFMQLINEEQNKELLKTVPHRQFQDLAIIYRIVAEITPTQMGSALVDKKLAKRIGMKESDLYDAAFINTKKLFPPMVKSMNEVLCELTGDAMADGEMLGTVEEEPLGRLMYVISNKQQINGATSMLYEEELHKLAEKLETDLYLMPSSIHETIAVSADAADPNQLAQMVTDINMKEVRLDERLSNQVYRYDKEQRKISLATDTPNKRLDRIVAEPPATYSAKQSR